MSHANGYATPESLFGAPPQRRFTDVEIDGHKFRLRSLTPAESNPWAVKSQKDKGMVTAGPRLIVLCVVNADGQRVFGDLDVAKFMELDSSFVARLAKACQDHAGLVDDVALEDAAGN